jgi:hypothetical protein
VVEVRVRGEARVWVRAVVELRARTWAETGVREQARVRSEARGAARVQG